MGRFFSYGIATRVTVTRKNDNEKVEKDKIFKQLGNYIDVDTYNVLENDNEMVLSIKEDFVNDNINKFLQEIMPLGQFYCSMLEKKVNDNTKVSYELSTSEDNKNDKRHVLKVGTTKLYEMAQALSFGNNWVFNENYFIREYSVFIELITLWIDACKIDGEDVSELLRITNSLKTNYFDNPLGKDLIFFITD